MTTLEPWVGAGGPFGLSWRTRPIWLWKRPALGAALSTRSSERCPRRRLNALRSSLVRQCLSKMADGSRRSAAGVQRVPLATAQGLSDCAAEWSRRFHRIAPNRRRIVVRPAAQTRVWCDRGLVRMPRPTGGAFFADAAAGGDGPRMLSEGTRSTRCAPSSNAS
jgi:hypothetical protein